MGNVTNQLIVVAATLLGFVAHDALSERSAPEPVVVASAAETAVDPVVTRSVNLDSLSTDFFVDSPRAERSSQVGPGIRLSDSTAAARPDPQHVETEFADIRVNDARVATPGRRAALFVR